MGNLYSITTHKEAIRRLSEAGARERPLPDDAFRIVATEERQDLPVNPADIGFRVR